MTVLGIDGALGAFSAAIARDDQVVASASVEGNRALEAGLALIAQTMEDARVARGDLFRIAVGIGPGGFTGVRIAISYAKALAQAWSLPLVPVSSFDLLERGRTFNEVLSVVVGRPGVISARYRHGTIARRASGRIAPVFAEILPTDRSGPLVVLGAPQDALDLLAERAPIVEALPSLFAPAVAAALAGARYEPARHVHDVRADYGELPAAQIPGPPKAVRR